MGGIYRIRFTPISPSLTSLILRTSSITNSCQYNPIAWLLNVQVQECLYADGTFKGCYDMPDNDINVIA